MELSTYVFVVVLRCLVLFDFLFPVALADVVGVSDGALGKKTVAPLPCKVNCASALPMIPPRPLKSYRDGAS